MARAYTGVFLPGDDGHALWVAGWDSFVAKWQELSDGGQRLHGISVSVEDGDVQFIGMYRAGTGGHALWVSAWDSFVAKWQELSGQGLRLVSIAIYEVDGTAMYAGAFLPGTDGYALWVSPWDSFVAKWQELSDGGLRLVNVSAAVIGGSPVFAGVFREGNAGHALWAAPWDSFVAKWQELSGQGLRLTSIDTYEHNGERTWVGAYLPGEGGHGLWAGVDWESFTARWNEWSQAGLRLVDAAGSRHGCTADALNQVVMPTGMYNYQVTGTGNFYSWPVQDTSGATRFARLSVLTGVEPFLRLPFTDTAVKRGGIWRYGGGGYHHAGDYSRDDSGTFEVKASADGRVLFVGWDNWSGNTVILSHDVNGVADAYRTIYMHLRDGATHDADAAWNNTVATGGLNAADLADYKTHLTDTGCTQDPATRSLDAAHWGTDAQTILVAANDTVTRGQTIAWAGNTGPGGKKGSGGPNTHLHIFWTRRDTDGEYYFFDPYGIYSIPENYAAGVTDATTGPCVRYPVAWEGGRPQYP
ncbi:Peptidase family M23 [Microbacterium sp. cf046]|uniref:M23 family metallopeptidase n=1 Tax=Microbacterium sp. cf046 TaxID=1761803 RepID=UPI0008E45950|nr:M23 family metallopeptidase [Microbacterium sp. cf046]SFR93573.1 Peptidase family M23 [Microbacterium sp. cf046]